jgi:ferredoxin
MENEMIDEDPTVDDNDDDRSGMTTDWPQIAWSASPSEFDMSPEEARCILKGEVQDLQDRQQQLQRSVSELKSSRETVAYVHVNKCAGCGLCTDVCLVNAIHIDHYAIADPCLCMACAACVLECPNEAIVISQREFND